MALKRTIALLGQPYVNEDGATATTIYPGTLVKGVTTIAAQDNAAGYCPRALALERDEMGKGIDASYGTETPYYSSGDTVKVGVFTPGQHALVLIASGQNITEDGLLEAAADGTLCARSAGVALARALESVNNAAGPTTAFLRVEWI